MKKVYVFFADGFEVVEALGAVDVFRRGKMDVVTVSIYDRNMVKASNNVEVKTDKIISEIDCKDADLVYIPGGYPGYENLGVDANIAKIVKYQYENNKALALICGGPTVLLKNKIAFGKKVTAHSSCKEIMSQNYNYTGKNIEVDGNLFTSIGAGHTIDFAIEICKHLIDKQSVDNILKGMELA